MSWFMLDLLSYIFDIFVIIIIIMDTTILIRSHPCSHPSVTDSRPSRILFSSHFFLPTFCKWDVFQFPKGSPLQPDLLHRRMLNFWIVTSRHESIYRFFVVSLSSAIYWSVCFPLKFSHWMFAASAQNLCLRYILRKPLRKLTTCKRWLFPRQQLRAEFPLLRRVGSVM